MVFGIVAEFSPRGLSECNSFTLATPHSTAFHRMDEIRAKFRRRKNAMQRAHFEGSMHAMDAVELTGHLSQFLGMHGLEEFVPFCPQSAFLRTLSLRHYLAQRLKPFVFASSRFNFGGEDH